MFIKQSFGKQDHMILVQLLPLSCMSLYPWDKALCNYYLLLALNKQQINWEEVQKAIKNLENGQVLSRSVQHISIIVTFS